MQTDGHWGGRISCGVYCCPLMVTAWLQSCSRVHPERLKGDERHWSPRWFSRYLQSSSTSASVPLMKAGDKGVFFLLNSTPTFLSQSCWAVGGSVDITRQGQVPADAARDSSQPGTVWSLKVWRETGKKTRLSPRGYRASSCMSDIHVWHTQADQPRSLRSSVLVKNAPASPKEENKKTVG